MQICVTQADIDEGDESPYFCPVARAIRRCTGVESVAVHDAIRVGRKEYALPAVVHEFIAACAEGQSAEPFSFQFPAPTGAKT